MAGNTTQAPVYVWWSPDGINMAPVTESSPFPVTISGGTIIATNPSVGTTGAVAPTSATEIGLIDASGNLQGVSASNPLPISGTFSASFSEPVLEVTGSVTSATTVITQANTQGYYSVWFDVTNANGNTLVCEVQNPTSGTWDLTDIAPVSTLLGQTSITATSGMFVANTGGKALRVRVSVYSTGTVAVDAFFRGFSVSLSPGTQPVSAASLPLPSGAATSALQTTGNTELTTINTTLGTPLQAGGTVVATQATATNLKAQIVGAGTAGTQSGGVLTIQGDPAGTPIPITGTISASNPSVSATGSAVPASATYIGANVGGTLTALVATASGLKTDGSAVTQPISASSLPLPTGASTSAKQPALGTAGTASTDVLTIQGIASMTALKVDGSGTTQPVSGTLTVQQTTAANLNATVVGTGTLAVQNTAATPAGSNIIGKVGIDQTTVGTTNAVSLAQVGATTVSAGAGAVGTGSQRVAVGQDTTTIAGSAPGTAGTPSANVVSVQGVASGTTLPVTASIAAAQTLATVTTVGAVTAITNDVNVLPATDDFVSGTASTTGATTTSVIAAVSGKRIYLMSVAISNSSASAVTVALQDGSGGTTLATFEVPAGGGSNFSGYLPLLRTTSGNGLFFIASSGVTTIYVNASGFSQ